MPPPAESEEPLAFPVIAVGKNKRGTSVVVYRTEERFKLCSTAGLKSGIFNNELVIDRFGKGHIVERAEYVRRGPRMWDSWFAPRLIEIRRIYATRGFAVPLEEIKSTIKRAIHADPEIYEAASWTASDLCQYIDAAPSVEGVMKVLTGFDEGSLPLLPPEGDSA